MASVHAVCPLHLVAALSKFAHLSHLSHLSHPPVSAHDLQDPLVGAPRDMSSIPTPSVSEQAGDEMQLLSTFRSAPKQVYCQRHRLILLYLRA